MDLCYQNNDDENGGYSGMPWTVKIASMYHHELNSRTHCSQTQQNLGSMVANVVDDRHSWSLVHPVQLGRDDGKHSIIM
jgi:hypothetical protein